MSGQGNRDLTGLRFSLNPKGYQFFTTTSDPSFIDGIKYYNGSGLFVKQLTADEPTYVAVASTVDVPPEPPEPGWVFVLSPGLNNTESAYEAVYDELLKIDQTNLKYHATPQPFYFTEPFAITDVEDLGNEATYKVKGVVLQRPLSSGLINFVGSKLLYGIAPEVLPEFDPRYVSGKARRGLIATVKDYYNQGCLQTVTNSAFGSRLFMIVCSTDGTFYAYPVDATREEDTDFIQAKYVIESKPSYPSWMKQTNLFEHIAATGRVPLDPVYSWSFNSTGTRSQAVVIERQLLNEQLWMLNHNRTYETVKPNARIYETNTGNTVLIDAERYAFQDESLSSEAIASDHFGWIELQFTIELTGSNLEEFTFSATVARSESPTNTAPLRVAAAYAKPLPWNNGIVVDDQIELFLTLRETTQQRRLREGLDGIHGLEYPQVGIWTIKVKDEVFLEFPEHLICDERQPGYNPVSYSCIDRLMTCDQYATELSDLDLGSLSFHRKVAVHQVVVPENPGPGYVIVQKNNASRIESFVFGVLDGIITTGHPEALSKIDGYLNSLDSLQQNTEIVLPSFTYKFRGRYVSVNSGDQTASLPPIWWSDVLWEPIVGIFLESYYAKTGSSQVGNNPPIVAAMDTINEGNFVSSIMVPIINYDSSTTGYNHFIDGPWIPADPWPGLSMLKSANTEFVDNDWTNTSFTTNRYAWLLFEIFKRFREDVAIGNTVFGSEYTELRSLFTLYSGNDYQIYNAIEPWLYVDLYDKTSDKEGVVKNYPWGHHWYTKTYNTGLTTSSKDGILSHPNGHYSYTYFSNMGYTSSMPFYEASSSNNGIVTYWNPRFKNTSVTMNANSIQQTLQDRVCFKNDNGYTETSHIDMYNQAFNQSETLNDYLLTDPFVTRSNTGEFYFGTNRILNFADRFNNFFFTLSHYADEVIPTVMSNPYAHPRNAPFFTR